MTFANAKHVKHALVQYICAGGYMHGILESLAQHQQEFLTHPETLCAQVPLQDKASCYHGVGHVYMLANERNAEVSVADCRRIAEQREMYRCFEGVRMEQFWGNTDHVGTTTLGWDPTDPLGTCRTAAPDAKPTCFLYSTFGYLRLHPKDYRGAVRMCTRSDLSASDTHFCLKGLGITMMSKFKGKNMEESEVYVTGLSNEEKSAFYDGVMGYAHLSGLSKSVLVATCGRFQDDRASCLRVVEILEEE